MNNLAPAVILSPESVADKLIRALQQGDVAVVLTRPRLERLIYMCDKNWTTQEDFEIYQELKNLRDQSTQTYVQHLQRFTPTYQRSQLQRRGGDGAQSAN